ncbi:hypothetical protein JNW88_31650, partial [Micromonospora sp. ATA32]|nr:hypothetical protein [Micromonospora sp. ATA32]
MVDESSRSRRFPGGAPVALAPAFGSAGVAAGPRLNTSTAAPTTAVRTTTATTAARTIIVRRRPDPGSGAIGYGYASAITPGARRPDYAATGRLSWMRGARPCRSRIAPKPA